MIAINNYNCHWHHNQPRPDVHTHSPNCLGSGSTIHLKYFLEISSHCYPIVCSFCRRYGWTCQHNDSEALWDHIKAAMLRIRFKVWHPLTSWCQPPYALCCLPPASCWIPHDAHKAQFARWHQFITSRFVALATQHVCGLDMQEYKWVHIVKSDWKCHAFWEYTWECRAKYAGVVGYNLEHT